MGFHRIPSLRLGNLIGSIFYRFTPPATNRRELRAQTTIDACRIPFYFSVYPSVSLCPMRASSAACRRSPKRNTHPFARRFRRPTYQRARTLPSSETILHYARFALCGECLVTATTRNLKRTTLSVSRFRFFSFVATRLEKYI